MNFTEQRDELIDTYAHKLLDFSSLKDEGVNEVDASVTGERIAAGRTVVPIDEAIQNWYDSLEALRAMPEGDDPSAYA